MVFGGIQFGGLASGLDTQAIIQALLGVEQIPIQNLQSNLKLEDKRLSLIGTLKGNVESLRSKADAFKQRSGFLVNTVSASEDGYASFSADGSAGAGSHSLIVKRLAAAARMTFDGVNNETGNLGAGSISFNYAGAALSVTVAAEDSSLNDIADALNDQHGEKIQATVVNAGTSSAPSWQLVIAGRDTGASNAITGAVSTVAGLNNPTDLVQADDAEIELDGLSIVRETNEFHDVLAGVEIDVSKADPTKTLAVTIKLDQAAVKKKLEEFVAAYNVIAEFVNKQSTKVEDEDPEALFGDSILRTVTGNLKGTLFNGNLSTAELLAQIADDTAGYGSLQLVGIELNKDGTLKLNGTKFDAKIEANLDAFVDLFTDDDGFDNGGALAGTAAYYTDNSADQGLFQKLVKSIERMTASQTVEIAGKSTALKGLFASREEAINDNKSRIDKQIVVLQDRLDAYENLLVARFTALEQTMGKLNAQQSYLTNNVFNNNNNQN